MTKPKNYKIKIDFSRLTNFLFKTVKEIIFISAPIYYFWNIFLIHNFPNIPHLDFVTVFFGTLLFNYILIFSAKIFVIKQIYREVFYTNTLLEKINNLIFVLNEDKIQKKVLTKFKLGDNIPPTENKTGETND